MAAVSAVLVPNNCAADLAYGSHFLKQHKLLQPLLHLRRRQRKDWLTKSVRVRDKEQAYLLRKADEKVCKLLRKNHNKSVAHCKGERRKSQRQGRGKGGSIFMDSIWEEAPQETKNHAQRRRDAQRRQWEKEDHLFAHLSAQRRREAQEKERQLEHLLAQRQLERQRRRYIGYLNAKNAHDHLVLEYFDAMNESDQQLTVHRILEINKIRFHMAHLTDSWTVFDCFSDESLMRAIARYYYYYYDPCDVLSFYDLQDELREQLDELREQLHSEDKLEEQDLMLITVHIGELDGDGSLPVTFTNMGGDELAAFCADPARTYALDMLQSIEGDSLPGYCKYMRADGNVLPRPAILQSVTQWFEQC